MITSKPQLKRVGGVSPQLRPKPALVHTNMRHPGAVSPQRIDPHDQLQFLRRMATQCIYSYDWSRKAKRSRILKIVHHAAPSWSYLDLTGSRIVIGLVLDGYVQEETAIGTTGYFPGDVFVADMRVPSWHRCKANNDLGGEALILLLDVAPELLTMAAFSRAAIEKSRTSSRAMTKEVMDGYETILTLIDAELYDAGAFRPEAMMIYLNALQDHMDFESIMADTFPFSSPEVSITLSYLRNNYSERMTYGKLSKDLGISRSRINRNCQASTQMSPIFYHQVLKSIRAKHLFEETNLSAREIALQIGAGNVASLDRLIQTSLSVGIDMTKTTR